MTTRPEVGGKKAIWKACFGIFFALLWVFASVVVSQLVVGGIMLAFLGADLAKPVPTAIYSALSYALAMIMIILIPASIPKSWRGAGKEKPATSSTGLVRLGRDGLGLHSWPTWTDIGLAPVGFVVYLVLAAGITALFSLFPWFDASEVQEVGFSYYISGGDRVIAFLTLVVVAPIAEEVIFRGWLYGYLRKRTSVYVSNIMSMVISALLVSVLFGAVHGQWNVGVNVFAMSLVLCGLREVTGTIYSGILLHMIKNGVAFYLLYVM